MGSLNTSTVSIAYNCACMTKSRCCRRFNAIKEQVCCIVHQSLHTLNASMKDRMSGRYEPIQMSKCASCEPYGLCSLNRLLMEYGTTLVCETVGFVMRPSFHEMRDNKLPQHPFMVPQHSLPLHCR
jgi:hypothetical protein